MAKKQKEQSESLFRNLCNKAGHYCLKLAIDKSLLNMGGQVFAKSMPCDYLVFKDNEVVFVEVKEVLKNDRFPNSRFKQQFRMTKLSNELSSLYKQMIFINFVAHKKLYYIPVLEYNKLIGLDKSVAIKDIQEKYEFNEI